MSWEIRIFDPTGATQKQSCSNGNPAGVVGGFEWEVKPDGDCVQWKFKIFANLMDVLEDDRLELFVDGTRVFYGSAQAVPDPDDENEKTVTVVGARESLKWVFPSRRRYLDVTDLATVITRNAVVPPVTDPGGLQNGRAGYKSDLPPHITYNAAQIETTLGSVRQWDFSLTNLAQILDRFTASATGSSGSVSWGVNANRELFAKSNNAVGTPSSYEVERLERTSEGIVTRVVVPIAQNPTVAHTKIAPREVRFDTIGAGWAFTGDPIVLDYQDAMHATYNRTSDIPLGLLDPLEVVASTTSSPIGVLNPANAFDGDSDTYASAEGTTYPSFSLADYSLTALDSFCAFEVEYSTDAETVEYGLRVSWHDTSGASPKIVAGFKIALTGTGQHKRNTIRLYAQMKGGTADTLYFEVYKDTGVTPDQFRIYNMRKFRLHPTLTQYAKNFIKLPEPVIARAKIPGRFGPFPRIDLGGTTYKASAYRYKLVETDGVDGLETIVDIGQRVQGETARVVNSAVRELDRRGAADSRAYVDVKAIL